jgi:biopolymer transport protein ExbD
MKRIGKKREGDISPDLTSFSDIANLLIIFFILTTSLARPFGRQMDMPSSAKPPEEQKNEADTPTINLSDDRITISENGKEGRELTMDQLRAELWKKNFPSLSETDRAVVLETSDDVKYERYYQVATAIAAAGGVVAIMEN